MNPKDYDRVGGGTYDVYKKKPKTDWAGLIGGGFVIFLVLAAIFGGK